MGNKNYSLPKIPPLVVPEVFRECMSYGQRQSFMWKKIKELDERVTELEGRINELTESDE